MICACSTKYIIEYFNIDRENKIVYSEDEYKRMLYAMKDIRDEWI